jgi:hypothetical protein
MLKALANSRSCSGARDLGLSFTEQSPQLDHAFKTMERRETVAAPGEGVRNEARPFDGLFVIGESRCDVNDVTGCLSGLGRGKQLGEEAWASVAT